MRKNVGVNVLFRVCVEMKRKHLSAEDGAALLRKSLMKKSGALFAVGVDSIILSLPLSVSLCCDVTRTLMMHRVSGKVSST